MGVCFRANDKTGRRDSGFDQPARDRERIHKAGASQVHVEGHAGPRQLQPVLEHAGRRRKNVVRRLGHQNQEPRFLIEPIGIEQLSSRFFGEIDRGDTRSGHMAFQNARLFLDIIHTPVWVLSFEDLTRFTRSG